MTVVAVRDQDQFLTAVGVGRPGSEVSYAFTAGDPDRPDGWGCFDWSQPHGGGAVVLEVSDGDARWGGPLRLPLARVEMFELFGTMGWWLVANGLGADPDRLAELLTWVGLGEFGVAVRPDEDVVLIRFGDDRQFFWTWREDTAWMQVDAYGEFRTMIVPAVHMLGLFTALGAWLSQTGDN